MVWGDSVLGCRACQHHKSALLDAWRDLVSGDLCCRKGSRGALVGLTGSMQLRNSSHVRDKDKALLMVCFLGVSGMICSLARSKGKTFHVGFVYGDGHFFWDCAYPPLGHIRESPEFHDIVQAGKSFWPRCLLLHGWLPALAGFGSWDPWAADAGCVARCCLEAPLGSSVSADRGQFGDFRWIGLERDWLRA